MVRGQDDRLTDAFELKPFTGRMTSGLRKQVDQSLTRAAILDPARWSLIMPIDPTDTFSLTDSNPRVRVCRRRTPVR